MIHGIIDIGSNTIRLAIYKVEFGTMEMLVKKKHMVGLAAYIKENAMQQEGIDRACAVLMEFKSFLHTFQITNVIAFTTAALRNIENSAEAVHEIRSRTGIDLQVISGDEEAMFDFIGATYKVDIGEGILIDIGGASTELVVYADNRVLRMVSLPIGSLAMYTKYVNGLLPNPQEKEVIAKEVLQCVAAEEEFRGETHHTICGIGGTFKGTAKLNNEVFGLPQVNCEIEVANLGQMIARFTCGSTIEENDYLAFLLKVVPERIKTILPGMIIADTLASYFSSQTILYSDSGVREGYLYDKVINKKQTDQ